MGVSPAAGADADAVLPVLRALAEPKRLAILSALRAKERCVRDWWPRSRCPSPW